MQYTITNSALAGSETRSFKSLLAAKQYATFHMASGNAMIWQGDFPLLIKSDYKSKWLDANDCTYRDL
jgi:hypothetical protein